MYRKGVDLLAGVISKMANMKNIRFLIGGDGPKRTLLEEVREKYNIQDKVTLLGALEHSKVLEVLRSGHIFLNTSLTEAYCMAIVEAASCGLQVVSTRVGGIPEVLPPELIHLTDATVQSLYDGLMVAIQSLQNERNQHQQQEQQSNELITNQSSYQNGTANRSAFNEQTHRNVSSDPVQSTRTVLCPYECNEILRRLYNWNDVTERTEHVYRRVLKESDPSFGHKLNCYLSACIPFVLVVSFSYLLLKFLDIIEPRRNIDIAIEPKTIQNHHVRRKQKRKSA